MNHRFVWSSRWYNQCFVGATHPCGGATHPDRHRRVDPKGDGIRDHVEETQLRFNSCDAIRALRRRFHCRGWDQAGDERMCPGPLNRCSRRSEPRVNRGVVASRGDCRESKQSAEGEDLTHRDSSIGVGVIQIERKLVWWGHVGGDVPRSGMHPVHYPPHDRSPDTHRVKRCIGCQLMRFVLHNALALSCGPDRGRRADLSRCFRRSSRQPYTPTASAPCYAGSSVHDRWPRPGPRSPLARSPATRCGPGTSGARREPHHRLPMKPAPSFDQPTGPRCAGRVAQPHHRYASAGETLSGITRSRLHFPPRQPRPLRAIPTPRPWHNMQPPMRHNHPVLPRYAAGSARLWSGGGEGLVARHAAIDPGGPGG
jgi:hypothetical protein